MPGGEKKHKKSGNFNSTFDRVNLKVKVHKPEMKKAKRNEAKKKDIAIPERKPVKTEVRPRSNENQTIIAEKKKAVEAIIETADEIEIRNERLAAKVEQQKKIIMWSGVTFFMLLIVIVWIYNARQILKPLENNNEEISSFDFGQIGDELSAKMKELKENLAEVKNFADNASSTAATSTLDISAASSTKAAPPLNNLPNSQSGSSTVATSTASADQMELYRLRKKLDDLEKRLEKK